MNWGKVEFEKMGVCPDPETGEIKCPCQKVGKENKKIQINKK